MLREAVVGVLVLGALAAPPAFTSSGEQSADGALRSVTLFNLPQGVSEAAFVEVVLGLNEAVHATGHMDAGYSLLKVTQAQLEDTPPIGWDYILIGHWTSQAVYDEIHGSPAFVEAAERYGEIIAALDEDRLYSRYEALAVGGPGEH